MQQLCSFPGVGNDPPTGPLPGTDPTPGTDPELDPGPPYSVVGNPLSDGVPCSTVGILAVSLTVGAA